MRYKNKPSPLDTKVHDKTILIGCLGQMFRLSLPDRQVRPIAVVSMRYSIEKVSAKEDQWCFYLGGWRLDIDYKNQMVHVANVALEGPEAGWCACVYDEGSGIGDGAELRLNGTETS